MPIGYRRGEIGAYSGEKPEEAGVAWKALDFEYRELGNEHTMNDVARFLGIKPTYWKEVLAFFKSRHGDTKGIWLTKTRKASREYRDFGPVEEVSYDKRDVIVDLGDDGIYVLDRRTPLELTQLDTGHKTESGEWVYFTSEEMKQRKKDLRRQARRKDKETPTLREVR